MGAGWGREGIEMRELNRSAIVRAYWYQYQYQL
jgi:hypothetical protein